MEKPSILIIDDDFNFCQTLSTVLDACGYKTAVAVSGIEAIGLLKQRTFDYLLLDTIMPVMDGLETLKQAKRISPNVKVVMLTAFSSNEIIEKALKHGASAVLRKPIDFNKLNSLIEGPRRLADEQNINYRG